MVRRGLGEVVKAVSRARRTREARVEVIFGESGIQYANSKRRTSIGTMLSSCRGKLER